MTDNKTFYLRLELNVDQETDQLIFEMPEKFQNTGKFYGAYVFEKGDKIIPLLIVNGLDNQVDVLGNTHLQITSVPMAQKKGQLCSPFTGNKISTLFNNFVAPNLSENNGSLPDGYLPSGAYMPKDKAEVLTVLEDFPAGSLPYYHWSISGFLALDRSMRSCVIKEPVLRFDPEVIVNTGNH